jgi:uracil-DNA glycosylase
VLKRSLPIVENEIKRVKPRIIVCMGITSQRTLREYTNAWAWKQTPRHTDTELAQQ